MITSSDSFSSYDLDKYYVILPPTTHWKLDDYISAFNARKVPEGFHYNSGTNTEWLTIDQIRNLIRLHVDPSFKIQEKYEPYTVR